MKERVWTMVVLGGMALIASAAVAQVHVGESLDRGLHWSVAAPGGASWRLECGHRPVTYYRNAYDKKAWANRFDREGEGASSGRLPGPDGRCTLTKTGGEGPVGLALVRVEAQGASETGHPVTATIL